MGGTRQFGDGVFEHLVAAMSDLPDATVWTLRFYGKVAFVAVTLPMAKLKEMEARTRLRLRFTG